MVFRFASNASLIRWIVSFLRFSSYPDRIFDCSISKTIFDLLTTPTYFIHGSIFRDLMVSNIMSFLPEGSHTAVAVSAKIGNG